MQRREFIGSIAALSLFPELLSARGKPRVLRAAPARLSLVGAAYPQTEIWGYDGAVPGPELRFRQGERLRIEMHNALPVDTTVHWHGLRVPHAMDGVPHVTQPPIAAGSGRFLYEFDLPDAGTFWYHPHLGSPEQVGRGLYGALVVEEREPPAVDRDLVWLLSDWRLDREARIREDFGHSMDASHGGRIGNTVTVNGRIVETFGVRAGERIRLRLVNASAARIYGLAFEGHEPMTIALDGHAVRPNWTERVVLGPGMRADLVLDCSGAPGSRHRVVDDFYRSRAYELLKIAYSDEAPVRSSFPPAPLLADNPFARPDLGRAERLRLVLGGGMMGALPSQREHKGLFWTVNGKPVAEHAHAHAPLFTLKRGRSYVMELVNQTSWHHPMHLHGHVFAVVSRDGKKTPLAQWGDTVLLDPDSRAEIAFVADNPGDWMLHCHVLEHQATGMMGLVRVA